MRRIVLGILLLAFTPQGVFAENEINQQSIHSWDNLRQLRPGQKIAVLKTEMKPVRGKFVTFTEEAVYLRRKKRDVGISRKEVLSVLVFDKPNRRRNTRIGTGIGALSGLFFGIATSGRADIPAGEFLFVLPGLGTGAGIGAAMPGKYRTIYHSDGKKDSVTHQVPQTQSPAQEESSLEEPATKETEEDRIATGMWKGVQDIQPGGKLLVRLKNGKNRTGWLIDVSDTKLILALKKGTVEHDRKEILRIYLYSPKPSQKSTLLGTGIGFAAGFVPIAAGANGGIQRGKVRAGLAVGGVAAGVGSLLGYIAGSDGSWVPVYDSRLLQHVSHPSPSTSKPITGSEKEAR